MKNIEYTKLNLKNFRKNLSSINDSGEQAYEITDRGKLVAYYIPSKYKVRVEINHNVEEEEYVNLLKKVKGCVKPTKETDYQKIYHKMLDKKYNKK